MYLSPSLFFFFILFLFIILSYFSIWRIKITIYSFKLKLFLHVAFAAADPQTLLQCKEDAEEKLAITDYELRLAQEDISKLKEELKTKTEGIIIDATTNSSGDVSVNRVGTELQTQQQKGNNNGSFAALGPLKKNERRDLNFAVKEYLLIAGYRLTAMTFYEEVYQITNIICHSLKCLHILFKPFLVLNL